MKSLTIGKILVIEDDKNLSEILKRFLELKNFKVEVKNNERSGFESVLNKRFDLIIVDIELDSNKGLNTLQKIRDIGIDTPIIATSDFATIQKEIESFNAGSDIFHKKPIQYKLLEAQIHSLLKIKQRDFINLNELQIDLTSRQIYKNGSLVNLTKSEFNVLLLFIKSQGRLFSREDIIQRVFDNNKDCQINSVDTLISRLRKKIGDLENGNIVETVFKSGYRIKSEYVSALNDRI